MWLCISLFIGCAHKESYNDYLIRTINTALSNNDADSIIELLSSNTLEQKNIIKDTNLLVDFVSGEITKVECRGSGTTRYSVDDIPVYNYWLSYIAYTDKQQKYHITIQYKKKNKVEPGKDGVWYIGISLYGEDNNKISKRSIGTPHEMG